MNSASVAMGKGNVSHKGVEKKAELSVPGSDRYVWDIKKLKEAARKVLEIEREDAQKEAA